MSNSRFPLVTIEEHFISEATRDSLNSKSIGLDGYGFPPSVSRKILALGDERVHDMNEGGICLQVISHAPNDLMTLDVCRQPNNQLYKATVDFPGLFAGFASLPVSEPVQAAEELSRCVRELNFVGALLPNHATGRFFDDEYFWPIFEQAQLLDVPIYLHPSFPSPDRSSFFRGNFEESDAKSMSGHSWGWHSEVGLHFIRLYASGVFDKYPRLNLIIGHNGEMLPFMIDRIEKKLASSQQKSRSLRTVWDDNVWVTTSGMFTMPSFLCLLRTKKVNRILYSVDYPLEDNKAGKEFFDEVVASGLLDDGQLEMFAYRNAETLLKVKAIRRQE